MAIIEMFENSPLSEYHGEFDLLPGQRKTLPDKIASELVLKFPKIFHAIDFEPKDEEHRKADEGETAKLRFKHNKFLSQYHGAYSVMEEIEGKQKEKLFDISFDEWGDERWIPFEKAKELLEKFPYAFEPVSNQLIKKNTEEIDLSVSTPIPKVLVETDKKIDHKSIANESDADIEKAPKIEQTDSDETKTEEENNLLDARIISLLEKTPCTMDEAQEKLNDVSPREVFKRIMQLAKAKRIQQQGDDNRWILIP